MFKLEVIKLDSTLENIYNMNKNDDDFLRFIPRNYGVPKENVTAYILDDDYKYEIENYLKLNENYTLDLGSEGKIKVVELVKSVDPTTEAEVTDVVLIKEYIGTRITWPYDTSGKFLGNGYEL